jgi:type II secretory pathway component PulK
MRIRGRAAGERRLIRRMSIRSRRARGVALLIVLVVLVIIATLATEVAVTARTTHRLADNSMDDLLLRSAVDGRIEILKAALRFDGTNGSGYDGEADEWSWHKREKLSGWGERGVSVYGTVTGDDTAQAAQYKTTDIEVTAWVEDERSKVNLRGLMKPEDSPVFQNTRDLLIRVIDLYREGHSSLDLSDADGKEMVDDLVRWLQAEADTEENPMPAVKPNRGRLQSADDLLRVPGGRWTPERLYDVKDPELDEEEEEEIRQERESSGEVTSTDGTDAGSWERQNGVGGLFRYLTVYAEDVADPPMRINVNTASIVVMKALFDPNDEDLAQKLIEHRREGADDTSELSGTSGSDSSNQGFFKTKQDLTKVEGMDQDLSKYPRLNFFADVASPVYSIRVIARAVSANSTGDAETETTDDGEPAPKELQSVYDFRMVVQRTNAGFVTLYSERRNDPRFDD